MALLRQDLFEMKWFENSPARLAKTDNRTWPRRVIWFDDGNEATGLPQDGDCPDRARSKVSG
jgi:hypothetical protein